MSGSDWTPVHHVHADEPEADPDKPPADGPTVDQRTGKKKPEGKSEEKGAPVGITLNLPPEFISAMWGYGDNVLRLAIAVEENTKTMKAMIEKNDSNSGRTRDETVRKRPVARGAGLVAQAAPANSGVE